MNFVAQENVYISQSGSALLGDFGLARLEEVTSAPTHCRDGTTIRFTAPEILVPEGTEVAFKTTQGDVYAFGGFILQVIPFPVLAQNPYSIEFVRFSRNVARFTT